MESGGGSNNQDGREGRTPPDEQQIGIGGARPGRGPGPTDDARIPNAPGGSGAPIGGAPGDSSFGGANRPSMPGFTPTKSADPGSQFRPWSEPGTSATGPLSCHFLRSVGADGRLADAQKTAVPTHRCAAFGDPLPLSLRQQELVCLQRVHVSCPRYVRGTLLANETPAGTAPEGEERRRFPVLTIAGVVLVVLAVGILLFALVGWSPFGGATPATHAPIAAATVTATPTPAGASAHTIVPVATPAVTTVATPAVTPLATHVATPVATPTPTHAPTASPTLRPTPTPAPTAAATSSWPPGATASRMDLVVPCPGQSDCYLYTVRGPGASGNGSPVADTVAGIAQFFGVDASKIYALNPTAASGITPGEKLKIPPPTR